jgi:hypothetical protein
MAKKYIPDPLFADMPFGEVWPEPMILVDDDTDTKAEVKAPEKARSTHNVRMTGD